MVAVTFGRWTRASLSLQVALVVLLSFVAAALVVFVTSRPDLRWRVDLTASGRNSLDPQTVQLLRDLPESAAVDIFYRAAAGPLGPPLAEVEAEFRELLFVATEQVPESLDVTVHDLYTSEGRAVADRRMAELEVALLPVVVVSLGDRRVVLQFDPDLASIDLGEADPRAYRPPSMAEFRGEEALAEALARLQSDAEPRVLFALGHGEYRVAPSPQAERRTLRGAGLLAGELRGDGFSVGTWDPLRDGPVPADCNVLAFIGPDQPVPADQMRFVEDFVDRGGSLLVAADAGLLMRDDALGAFLERHGLVLERGIVNAPVRDPRTGNLIAGTEQCELLDVDEERLSGGHPITAPLRERGRRLRFIQARSFDRLPAPAGTLLFDLVGTPENAWRDLPDAAGRWNHALDPATESRTPSHLALAAEIDRPDGGDPARLVAIGAATAFDDELVTINLDFVRNTFNWLADRDVRIRVARRDPFEAKIDVQRGDEFPTLWNVAVLGLPGLCLALGLVIAFARRRG